MPLENGSHEFRNRTEHICDFLCVFLDSGPPSLEFERVFTTPEWLHYLITLPTSGSPCMTLLRTDSLNYSAPLYHRNIPCTHWTSLPTGMRVGTEACQSDGTLLGEQANGAALFGRHAYQSPAGLSVNGCSWNLALPTVIVLRMWNIVERMPVRNITLF